MTDHNADHTSPTSRRSLLAIGGAAALVGSVLVPDAASADQAATSTLDKWIATKTIRIGYEFGTPPMQYRDPATNEPAGYTVELTKMMAADLGEGIKIEYVEIPFGQLFAALDSGKCDIIEPVTNLPSRALRGSFLSIPAFYAPVYVILKPTSTITKPEELDAAGIKFALLQGTSQASVAKARFPKASFSTFPGATDAINEIASGRADASVQSASSVMRALDAGARIKVLATGPLFSESVSYFIRQNDPKLLAWLNNWISYRAAVGTLQDLYVKTVGSTIQSKYNLKLVAVGAAGVPVPLN